MVGRLSACYIQLGRFGDIMIILPALKQKFDETGERPVVMVCTEFAGILDGVSYVDPFPVWGIPWHNGVRSAKMLADQLYDEVVIPKWWDCHGMEPPVPRPNEPFTELDWQGRKLVVSQDEWSSYQYSQWKACGLTRQQMLDWPLVFDRRSRAREQWLVKIHLHPKKPNVLYNFTGTSNPVGFEPEIIRAIAHLRGRVNLVDLGRIRAHRIYDLLGLYDHAACLITGDTATLHLAAASRVNLIALLANGGAGSIVKGNETLRLRYHEIRDRVDEIAAAVEKTL